MFDRKDAETLRRALDELYEEVFEQLGVAAIEELIAEPGEAPSAAEAPAEAPA